MKNAFALLTAVALMLSLVSCGSSQPCHDCGRVPTKGYKNNYTGETEYYCSVCSSDCEMCSSTSAKHPVTLFGQVVFLCDDCDEELRALFAS